jgi:hypothetical protein
VSVPTHMGAFEFVVLASLRTAQLMRGCTAKVASAHKHATTAQWEISAGKITNTGRSASPPQDGAAGGHVLP